jgi:hypothetical protein
MMEIGSGIAIAGVCISGGAITITAIRTFASRTIENRGKNGLDGPPGRDGLGAIFPCKAHSGLVACFESIQKTQDRQELWLNEISKDIKQLLRR